MNVGIAVAVDNGLLVPVIHNADQLSISGVNRQVQDLAARARTNKLRLEDIQGGTFTVNNTGWFGSVTSMPIINAPEVAILSMEAIVKRPVVREVDGADVIAIRPMMNMTCSFDHRVLDGAQVGYFLADVRKRMGFLFQNSALFDSMTVGENVAFPMRRHTDWPDRKIRERARQKLAEVGLERDVEKMPGDLSGGMKKRAGLARAMALDPSILLVDEPSAGLDPMTSAEIDELLVERKRTGTTIVVVTHNIPSARIVADELAILDKGRIIARGTVDELDASADPLVQAFMRSQRAG